MREATGRAAEVKTVIRTSEVSNPPSLSSRDLLTINLPTQIEISISSSTIPLHCVWEIAGLGIVKHLKGKTYGCKLDKKKPFDPIYRTNKTETKPRPQKEGGHHETSR